MSEEDFTSICITLIIYSYIRRRFHFILNKNFWKKSSRKPCVFCGIHIWKLIDSRHKMPQNISRYLHVARKSTLFSKLKTDRWINVIKPWHMLLLSWFPYLIFSPFIFPVQFLNILTFLPVLQVPFQNQVALTSLHAHALIMRRKSGV